MSATVRFTTAQPLLTPPAIILNRYIGRQWWALSALLPGADRINGTPARPLTDELDTAIAVGSSGVMLGKVDDAFMLMLLANRLGPPIVIDFDDDLAASSSAASRPAVNSSLCTTHGVAGPWPRPRRPSGPPPICVHSHRGRQPWWCTTGLVIHTPVRWSASALALFPDQSSPTSVSPSATAGCG